MLAAVRGRRIPRVPAQFKPALVPSQAFPAASPAEPLTERRRTSDASPATRQSQVVPTRGPPRPGWSDLRPQATGQRGDTPATADYARSLFPAMTLSTDLPANATGQSRLRPDAPMPDVPAALITGSRRVGPVLPRYRVSAPLPRFPFAKYPRRRLRLQAWPARMGSGPQNSCFRGFSGPGAMQNLAKSLPTTINTLNSIYSFKRPAWTLTPCDPRRTP